MTGLIPIRSAEILEAVQPGKGGLDLIDFVSYPYCLFEDELVQEVQTGFASNLNHQRRLHGPVFQELAKAATRESRRSNLAKAFAAVDNSTRFSFLRGNEWGCRESLIQELPSGTSNKKRRRSELDASDGISIDQQSAKNGRIEYCLRLVLQCAEDGSFVRRRRHGREWPN